jgi:hypothetical protein
MRKAGAAVVPLIHGRKLSSAEATKPRRPTIDDAFEGNQGIMNRLDGAISLWRPDADDKHRLQVVCVREVRAGFEPFELRFRDVPRDGNPQWGLRVDTHTPADATTGVIDLPPTPAQEHARAVAAAVRYMSAVTADAGNGVRKLPTESVVAMVAAETRIKPALVEAALHAACAQDNVTGPDQQSIEVFPLVHVGGKQWLELRRRDSTPQTAFGVVAGWGAPVHAPVPTPAATPPVHAPALAPFPAPAPTPATTPPVHAPAPAPRPEEPQAERLRQRIEAIAAEGGGTVPAQELLREAGLAQVNVVERRRWYGVLKSMGCAVTASKGPYRPATVTIGSPGRPGT